MVMIAILETSNTNSEAAPQSVGQTQLESQPVAADQMNDCAKIAMVAEFIEADEKDYHGLTATKIRERGTLSEDPARPAWIIVKLKRHYPTLGAKYHKGSRMSAYLEYYQTIAFNPETKEIEINDDKHSDDATLHIDDGIFGDDQVEDCNFDFGLNTEGKIVCRETCGKNTCVVTGQHDVEEFAREICRAWPSDCYEAELADYFRGQKLEKTLEQIRDALEMALVTKAVRFWRDYEKSASQTDRR